MTRRDPRIDPREGDVLYQANGTREIHVDKVGADKVGYRVTDGNGGLLAAYRIPLANWRESAPYTCSCHPSTAKADWMAPARKS